MDSNSARHGSKTSKRGFELFARCLHQVSKLVDDYYDVGHFVLGQIALTNSAVIRADVSYTQVVKQRIAPFHLANAVLQSLKGFFCFRDNWRQEMWNIVVKL
ncbi:MAG: hypothetical protein BWX44_01553 [Spirochaetes bacterium ADurb.Bin001]|nr:MAG: hypothetical protein BWX44_01553 [Spirochaetes bacterium ADurb.Bin001]